MKLLNFKAPNSTISLGGNNYVIASTTNRLGVGMFLRDEVRRSPWYWNDAMRVEGAEVTHPLERWFGRGWYTK